MLENSVLDISTESVMIDIDQKAEEYGTTILKLIRVKSAVGGNVKFFGNIMLVIKHYKENDTEIMAVKIASITSQSSITANLNNIAASGKLSLNKITAMVNHKTNSIDFGPSQGVLLDEFIRGKGIGTYAFNEIVLWLKKAFGEYAVNPFDFSLGEYSSETEKSIRNDFLEHFGFTIDFSDPTQTSGTAKIKKASSLKEHYNSDKIDELDIEKYVFGLIGEKYKLEKDYGELKHNYETRGTEVINGIPKSDIIKYTLGLCIAAIALLIFLLQ